MKKRYRRLLSILLSVIMLFSLTGAALAAFTDIEGHWAQETIERWLAQDLVSGYPDGTFRPNSEVSRAEFITFLDRAVDLAAVEAFTGFNDVSEGDWFYGHVVSAVQAGILSGYPDGTFRPNQDITRQEAAAILTRLLQLEAGAEVTFADKEAISAWAKLSVRAAVEAGIMMGYPDLTFRPQAPITRAETVTILDRALGMLPPVEVCVVVTNLEELRVVLLLDDTDLICFPVDFILEMWGLDEEQDDLTEEDIVPGGPGLFRMMREEGVTHMVIDGVTYDLNELDDLNAIRDKVSADADRLLNDGLEVTLIHETLGARTATYRVI